MCGTGALLRLSEALPLMNSGMGESLMSLTFESGGVLVSYGDFTLVLLAKVTCYLP